MGYTLFVVFGLVISGMIVYMVFFTKKAQIKRKLRNTNVIDLSDFKDGDIGRIIGNVEFIDTPLVAPLTNRKCAFYYVLIEQKVSSSDTSHWKKIIEREVSGKFLIRDGENYAYINDRNLKSYIVQDKKFSSGFLENASEHLEKYLYSNGFSSEGTFGFNKTLRYKEGILEDQEMIAVLGKGTWKSSSDLNLPDNYGSVLEIKSPENMAVYLSDDPDALIRKTPKQRFAEISNGKEKRYRK